MCLLFLTPYPIYSQSCSNPPYRATGFSPRWLGKEELTAVESQCEFMNAMQSEGMVGFQDWWMDDRVYQ